MVCLTDGPRRPDVPRPALPDWFWERRAERILARLREQVQAARREHDRAHAAHEAYWTRVEALAGDWTPPEA